MTGLSEVHGTSLRLPKCKVEGHPMTPPSPYLLVYRSFCRDPPFAESGRNRAQPRTICLPTTRGWDYRVTDE